MRKSFRVLGMLSWLGFLGVGGAVVLGIASERVGEHRSSEYGRAYHRFERSWGGEIGVPPAKFYVERTYTVEEYDVKAQQYRDVVKKELIQLIPVSLDITAALDYGEQDRNWLTFNAFTAQSRDVYRIRNGTRHAGRLLIQTAKPSRAHLMYDYEIVASGEPSRAYRPGKERIALLDRFEPGQEQTVAVSYGTKGMDVFKYDLSAYQHSTIGSLRGVIHLNTDAFHVYRFGLPHTRQATDAGVDLHFETKRFATTQDMGVSFISKNTYLDHVQSLLQCSMVSPIFFLLTIFVFAQVRGLRFSGLHYLFITLIAVFYFLFVAYLIRFFGVWTTFGLAAVLTALMHLVYCPGVFGWSFAIRVAGVYLALLTVVFSLIFLMPVFRGVLFLGLLFFLALSVMVCISRSDISRWPLLES